MQALPFEPGQHNPTWRGLALSLIVGTAAFVASDLIQRLGIGNMSSMTLALAFGLIVGNWKPSFVDAGSSGLAIAKKEILRTAIVLYGFRLTLSDFAAGGLPMLLLDTTVVVSTFAFSIFVGCRILKMEFEQAALVGAGAAICGNSAVLATSAVLKGDTGKCAVAVATVAVFGTAAFLIYPAIYQLMAGTWLFPANHAAFGAYIGATVHEVGQVVATAAAIGRDAVDAGVVAKMGRVALLAPFLCALLWWSGRTNAGAAASLRGSIPLFPFLFVAVVLFNTAVPLEPVREMIDALDGWALATSMGALGLTTRLSAIRAAGTKPLALGALLLLWLVIGGALAAKAAQLVTGS